MHYITLNNGVEMPIIGMGTHTLHGFKMIKSVKRAYNLGYRNFDTAWLYNNEKSLKWALKLSGIKREDVFITSKLEWKDLVNNRLNGPQVRSARQCFQETLKRLGTNYLDLYLIHWPNPKYFLYMWEEMVKLYQEGLIRAIGVSSFLEPHLQKLKEVSDVIPAVNQIELHPLNNRKELVVYCNNNNIQIEAHSPFARGAAKNELMQHPILLNIASKHQRSVGQIILRWIVQQGFVTIPRSVHQKRLQDNINVFDFMLTNEDMDNINSINQNKFFGGDPHKSLIDLK